MESRLSCAPNSQVQRSAAEGTMKNTGGRKTSKMLPLNRVRELDEFIRFSKLLRIYELFSI